MLQKMDCKYVCAFQNLFKQDEYRFPFAIVDFLHIVKTNQLCNGLSLNILYPFLYHHYRNL